MLALAAMTIMAAAIAVLFPETPLARGLKRWLIEAPARGLTRAAVWKFAFWTALIVAGLMMTILFEAEGLMVYGAMAPEAMAWAALFDVGVMIDALVIAAAVTAADGLKVVRLRLGALRNRAVPALRRAVGRTRREPRARPGRKAANDDPPAGTGQPGYRAFSMA